MGVPQLEDPAADNQDESSLETGRHQQAEPERIKLHPGENPINWPAGKKWSSTIILVLMVANIAFCSSIHAATVEGVETTFKCSKIVAKLGITTFLIGLAAGTLLFAPISEVWGRLLVFRFTLGLFVCFNAGCALAPNIQALLIFRFLSGFFGSSAVANTGGALADIWPQSHRSVPFALFATAGSLGPVFAPIVGGFISQYLTWRGNYWLLSILSGVIYVAMIIILPETYASVLLQWKMEKAGIQPANQASTERYVTTLTRPWMMLFTEPILFTLGLYSACLWGILYLNFTAYPFVFQTERKWDQGVAGLSLLGITLGMIIATASSPWIDDIYCAYTKKLKGPKPEARLPHLIFLAWLVPVALFWFGWSATPPTHWMVCMSAGIPFGISFITLFLGANAYLTDCYGRFSASALAAHVVMRLSFGGTFPLFATRLYVKLGTPWASSTLSFITLAMAPVPWLFYTYGKAAHIDKVRNEKKYLNI
ncbi:hypothetical protein HYFRA_00001671 [Hymenoscyphus fraxineus]|uniref:Major facilitator superfamily (MFS) profile domain-containing protein n=1 Tax=Hymenoscyphus fraxineus TaxID=746836 RepID=A0A9N9PML1_9HELO|nr:hypothetical protein HYFRA_00001671 [Hymenoscyphus fraxineus]